MWWQSKWLHCVSSSSFCHSHCDFWLFILRFNWIGLCWFTELIKQLESIVCTASMATSTILLCKVYTLYVMKWSTNENTLWPLCRRIQCNYNEFTSSLHLIALLIDLIAVFLSIRPLFYLIFTLLVTLAFLFNTSVLMHFAIKFMPQLRQRSARWTSVIRMKFA